MISCKKNLPIFVKAVKTIKLPLHTKHQNKNKYTSNCQEKENCPINGACLLKSLVYYATISWNNKNYKPKLCKGCCELSFKKRYSNHKKLFSVPLYKHNTKLSTKYWNLKTMQLNPRISWKIKGV